MKYEYMQRVHHQADRLNDITYRNGQHMVRLIGISAVTAASVLLAIAVGFTLWRF
jgi:hypothetical protein